MEFDLVKLKAAGKIDFDFEERYPVSEVLSEISGAVFAEDPIVAGHISVLERSSVVDCVITYRLRGECSRCLAETEQTFTCRLSEEFTADLVEDAYRYVKNRLVLDRAVEDAILTSLPLRLLCREDCKGICSVCGKDRNLSPCDCVSNQE